MYRRLMLPTMIGVLAALGASGAQFALNQPLLVPGTELSIGRRAKAQRRIRSVHNTTPRTRRKHERDRPPAQALPASQAGAGTPPGRAAQEVALMDAATARRQAGDALRIGIGLYDARETVSRLAEELKRVPLDRAVLEDVLAAQQRLEHAVRHCEHYRQRMARIAAAEQAAAAILRKVPVP